jgi:hypothetical protein
MGRTENKLKKKERKCSKKENMKKHQEGKTESKEESWRCPRKIFWKISMKEE